MSITPTVETTVRQQQSEEGQLREYNECNDDDDDDDEVEFLHTNPPPQYKETPATNQDDSLYGRLQGSKATEETNSVIELEPTTTSISQETSTGTSTTMISPTWHTTSAYLQSLAEISHAILWDARWRVGGSRQRRLFAWEQGDDMNALHKLSKRYIQLSNPPDTPIECEPDDRCLETYARLYFRKGPWFRLDNIYKSYYAPKMTDLIDDSEIGAPAKKKLTSPSKFFRRRNYTTTDSRNSASSQKAKSTTSEDDYIDQDFVDLQIEAVVDLLGDIKRLFRMGLIRSFEDEEECGKIVGKRNQRYEYAQASLLRQDEQRTVLSKLGGGQKQKKRPTSSTSMPNGSSGTTPLSESQQQPLENLIWKQMCQQQTIFNCFKNGRNSTVLPVMKHVHDILLQKWASAIVFKASKVEYIPAPILRNATKRTYNMLLDLTRQTEISASTILCIRLREAPLRTLQRACRLYLCANAGPGDMRNTGTNAWRSLPDSHTKDLRNIPLRTNVVAPPGSSWNTVSYPGKDWRLRVISCHFMKAFRPTPVEELRNEDSVVTDYSVLEKEESCDAIGFQADIKEDAAIEENACYIQVFSSVKSFQQWEKGVELRENCDFLLELNELLLYNQRREARERKLHHDQSDISSEDGEDGDGDTTQSSSEDDDNLPVVETKVDFLDLLTIVGRANIIRSLLSLQKNDGKTIISKIERDISTLLGIPLGDRPLSALLVSPNTGKQSSECIESSRLKNECERVLGVIGIILIHILEFRNGSIDTMEASNMIERPWLRHMYWEGCMSYVLWDIIPILERRGYHEFAISALEVLLFGKRLSRASNKMIPDFSSNDSDKGKSEFSYFYQPLISRRARGKALDRLIIDYTHFFRKNKNTLCLEESEKAQAPTQSKKKNASKSNANEVVNKLAESFLRTSVASGQISFSSIRTLARRLKRPLSITLKGLQSYEASELGHRLSNIGDKQQDLTKYNDWSPATDKTVANSMTNDRDSIGGRCSFVGFEEDEHAVRMGSLNVEELAKEYYHQGRLPACDESTPKGGWIGYHDEGGKIRILFRILSSSVLGMDWNTTTNSILSNSESSTIHLTPYQGAPFDLHVGAENVDVLENGCRGIYARRKSLINSFLEELSNLDGEDLSAFVYDRIEKRVEHTNSLKRPDLTLESDLRQVRTLSMLAVGFGGKMLASMFRCFFFDYRHYSGGLPDLLLVRALYTSSTKDDPIDELVDLGEWVGEEFSSEYQEAVKAKQISRIFMDTDSDFLGCSKVGDSGGRATSRFQRPGRTRNPTKEEDSSKDEKPKIPYTMPEKLRLRYNSRQIRVECMFVEVKSQNDRLDSRQEDWLNILDLHGNARVCKFEKAAKRDKIPRKGT